MREGLVRPLRPNLFEERVAQACGELARLGPFFKQKFMSRYPDVVEHELDVVDNG